MKKICFTVTNDLNYDQRMQRICTTLAANGYIVTLVGRRLSTSPPLTERNYRQKRIRCWFNKGKWFYAEYNIRLFLFLLFHKMDAVCAVDLDTILPCLAVSRWKKIPRIYDAHELFTELKEVISRPAIHNRWLKIEKRSVPRFTWCYTVSDGIADEFRKRYNKDFITIRNMPLLQETTDTALGKEQFILYQGAVNEGRGFEYLVPAMHKINCKLVVCGDGNFMPRLRRLIAEHRLEDKIELKGMLPPEELVRISRQAVAGVAIAEKEGLNQWLALPNKFFDYIHAALPQVTMDYPEYRKINAQFEVAVLISEPGTELIASAVNRLLEDEVLRRRLKENCIHARQVYNWQQEEKKLLDLYQRIFST